MGMDFEVVPFPPSLAPKHAIPYEFHGQITASTNRLLKTNPSAESICKKAKKLFTHEVLPNTADLAFIKKLVASLKQKFPQIPSHSQALGEIAQKVGHKTYASLLEKSPVVLETPKERESKLLSLTLWTAWALDLVEQLGATGLVQALLYAAATPIDTLSIQQPDEKPSKLLIYPNGTMVWMKERRAIAYPMSELGLVAVKYECVNSIGGSVPNSLEDYLALEPQKRTELFHLAWIHSPIAGGPGFDEARQYRCIQESLRKNVTLALKAKEAETLYKSPYILLSVTQNTSDIIYCSPRFELNSQPLYFRYTPSEKNTVSTLLDPVEVQDFFACEVVRTRQQLTENLDALRMYLFTVQGAQYPLEQVASISFKDRFYLKEEMEYLIEYVRPLLKKRGLAKTSDLALLQYLLATAEKAKEDLKAHI